MNDDPTLPAPSDAPGGVAPVGTFGRFRVIAPLGAGGMGVVVAAHDPELDRKVAIKILRGDVWRGGDGRARLAREAQAMAKVAHPNVVTVHEVGEVGDQLFIVMELVEGETLRAWLAARPRARHEILAKFVAAGRGLGAAHAAGLVHRDVKPDNVLIGRDGRPRVADFGLVVGGRAAIVDDDTGASGTPAYMSAEQWEGDADPRSDQFSFCVALWEALWGARPFPGGRPAELRAAVRAGVIVGPPRDRRGPRWLEAVLRVGLSADPAARWPSMDALLDQLERRPRRRRRLALVAAAAAASALIVGATVLIAGGGVAAPDPCAPPTARVAAVWSLPRAFALARRMRAIDPEHGGARFGKAAAAFDREARGWTDMHVEACRATRVDGRQSDSLLDRRMACLDRRLVELDQTVTIVETSIDRDGLDGAARAIDALSPLDACADTASLSTMMPLPSRPADRAAAVAVWNETSAIEVARVAGRTEGMLARARAAVAKARGLDNARTLTEALEAQADVEMDERDDEAAAATLRELTQVAALARDDVTAARTWVRLLGVLGDNLGRPDDAVPLIPAAAAAVTRAGNPPLLRYELLEAQAQIAKTHHDWKAALAFMEEGLRVVEAAGAATAAPGSPLSQRVSQAHFQIANIQLESGDYDTAAASFAQVAVERRAQFGPDNPDLAIIHAMRAEALRRAGKLDLALAAALDAAQIAEAIEESPLRAILVSQVGDLYVAVGRPAEAVPHLERGLAVARRTMPAADPDLAGILDSLGAAHLELHHLDAARPFLVEAQGVFERAGRASSNRATNLLHLARLHELEHRCPDAVPLAERAIAMFGEAAAVPGPLLVEPRGVITRCR